MKKLLVLLLAQFGSFVAHAASSAGLTTSITEGKGLYAIATALAISVAVLGGALGQGKIGASAMEGLSRNPGAQKNMFVSMILGLAFIESLVIFAFVVAFLIVGKL